MTRNSSKNVIFKEMNKILSNKYDLLMKILLFNSGGKRPVIIIDIFHIISPSNSFHPYLIEVFIDYRFKNERFLLLKLDKKWGKGLSTCSPAT